MSGVSKSFTTIVIGLICDFTSRYFCFIKSDASVFKAYIFRVLTSSLWVIRLIGRK